MLAMDGLPGTGAFPRSAANRPLFDLGVTSLSRRLHVNVQRRDNLGSLNSADRTSRGYAYGGPAFVGGIVVGIGLGILLGDFFAWLLIGFGAGVTGRVLQSSRRQARAVRRAVAPYVCQRSGRRRGRCRIGRLAGSPPRKGNSRAS